MNQIFFLSLWPEEPNFGVIVPTDSAVTCENLKGLVWILRNRITSQHSRQAVPEQTWLLSAPGKQLTFPLANALLLSHLLCSNVVHFCSHWNWSKIPIRPKFVKHTPQVRVIFNSESKNIIRFSLDWF